MDSENIYNNPPTPESIWEFLNELARRSAETDRQMAESDARFDKRSAETDRQIRELNDKVNGISKSNGLFAEEYFFNSFSEGKRTFFGETFDEIIPCLKTGLNEKIKDEYDIVFLNGKSVGIVEIKYKGRLDDIPKIISKAETFRVNYPQYKNHRIYLAFASTVFNQRLEDECSKEGIAIVKQAGNTVVINDKKLKVF